MIHVTVRLLLYIWIHEINVLHVQAIGYYAMVPFRTIDLKSHPIAQFEENRIICKKKKC